ncbi:hypothetical protein TruAng_006827 [Truncatella angustata]|nr:hypothetical protein TruAng_006827 [Truncatella angustata]
MAAEVMMHPRYEHLNADDFETASIRSAAPSYVSEAPSYHSTLPPNETLPSYAQARADAPPRTGTTTPTNSSNPRSMVPPAGGSSTMLYGPGLPPVRDLPPRTQMPQLEGFRIPSWSTTHSNPNARHYQNVAQRRASRARNNDSQMQETLRSALSRLNEVEDERERARVRPLEDPYLVGEEAASRARRERLARENGDDILILEDRRWDWFLGQMKDWDERRESWQQFESRRTRRSRWGF